MSHIANPGFVVPGIMEVFLLDFVLVISKTPCLYHHHDPQVIHCSDSGDSWMYP